MRGAATSMIVIRFLAAMALKMFFVFGARVVIRVPATLGDFVRQRIRIEMGKVQLAAEYPDVRRRAVPQPGLRVITLTSGDRRVTDR